ncbi:DUF1840 domain-containing protein [Motiliproteus sp. SC1-56]|uniref:DUF1840 domain-containing protein n=1 Tax=Motiliproteus sp. SC1-56 TaxID=2799565 RepID=UPI001A8CC331|nr:DUF1840 domain-containing protein [Motiliproteus sp. SC1-56]
MLITFSSPAYASFTMFGESARRLIKLMGHSGEVPGAILAEDIPACLDRLRAGLAQLEEPAPDDNGYDTEPAISLSNRALPLVEMLEAAVQQQAEVIWDSEN